MTFPKKPLHDELFAREWPEKYPFPPEAFKRQDEQDDSDFYSTPRLVYHIDEGNPNHHSWSSCARHLVTSNPNLNQVPCAA